MNKQTLAERLVSELGLSRNQAVRALDKILEIIIETLKSGQEVKLSGFGTFSARTRHARNGVNPQKPSEKINIPAVRVAKFKTGKTLKDAMKEK